MTVEGGDLMRIWQSYLEEFKELLDDMERRIPVPELVEALGGMSVLLERRWKVAYNESMKKKVREKRA